MSEHDSSHDDSTQELPSGNQADQTSTPAGAEGSSRRKFLRAALVGSAAVVAVGAGADAVLSHVGGKSLSTIRFLGPALASPTPPTFDADFEESGLAGCVPSYGTNATYYLVFTASNLPAGNYSFNMTQQFNGGTIGPIQPNKGGTAALPFEYQANGNNVHVDTLTAGNAVDCPAPKTAPGTGSNVLPVTFSLSTTGDVQIYVHFAWYSNKDVPAAGTPAKFTGTITNTDTNTTVGSDSVTVPASGF